jgi:YHS domain-containing protein
MITKNGVYYDLTKSTYTYKDGGLTYVFSSKLHLDKFKKKLKENRDIINYSLSKRFNVNVKVSQLADIVLYKKIETRGFLIYTVEGKEICQESVTFVGGEVTTQN